MQFPVGLSLVGLLACAPLSAQSVSDQLQQRTGFALPDLVSEGAAFSLPSGVTFDNDLTVRSAVAIALWNNSALQAELAALEVSRADLVEAAMFKNPSLSTLFAVGPKPFEFLLAWPIEELWQRKQRVKAATTGLDAVSTGLIQNGLDLMRDVRLAHTDLWLAESRTRILQESADLRARLATLSQRKRDAGEGTGLDLAIAEADAQATAELARIAADDVVIARARLRYLLGIRRETQIANATTFHAAPNPAAVPALSLPSLLDTAMSNRPDLRAAEIKVQAAGERARWQQSQVLAMMAPTLSIKEIGSEGLRAGPGLNMEIPILSRNQGRIKRADAEVVQAGRQYAALKDRVEQEVAEAFARLTQTQASQAQLTERVRPPVERSIQLSQRAFESGDIPIMNVLEATRQIHDINLRQAEAAAALQRALAQLERAIGKGL
jgi:cobalt-zinc-cadmium efflux system outer membrane protein